MENSSLKDQILCKICMEKNVSIAFLPCGHLACCEDCSPAMRKCPICRQFVRGTVKIFSFDWKRPWQIYFSDNVEQEAYGKASMSDVHEEGRTDFYHEEVLYLTQMNIKTQDTKWKSLHMIACFKNWIAKVNSWVGTWSRCGGGRGVQGN